MSGNDICIHFPSSCLKTIASVITKPYFMKKSFCLDKHFITFFFSLINSKALLNKQGDSVLLIPVP